MCITALVRELLGLSQRTRHARRGGYVTFVQSSILPQLIDCARLYLSRGTIAILRRLVIPPALLTLRGCARLRMSRLHLLSRRCVASCWLHPDRATCALLRLGTLAGEVRSSSAFRLLATCYSSCLHTSCFAAISFQGFLVGTPNQSVSSWDRIESLPGPTELCPSLQFIWANFGRSCSLSTALPTNYSMPAILRESAEASHRFAYAIIFTPTWSRPFPWEPT